MPDLWYQLRIKASNVFSREPTEGLKLRLEVVLLIIGILSGFGFGLDQWKESNDKSTEIVALEKDKARLNKENAGLRAVVNQNDGTIEQLHKEVSDLTRRNIELERDEPMPPDDFNSPPLRNNTSSLRLARNGDSIDLDVPDDPTFGMAAEVPGDANLFYQGDGTIYIDGVAIAQVQVGEVARYATCAIAQGFQSLGLFSTVDVNDIDDRTCFRLESGRYATIKVIKSNPEQVELAIRVWESAD